jgi:hypothetical protein
MTRSLPAAAAAAVVLGVTAIAGAQEFAPEFADDAMASLPLDDAIPSYRPDVPRPVTTQPATQPAYY